MRYSSWLKGTLLGMLAIFMSPTSTSDAYLMPISPYSPYGHPYLNALALRDSVTPKTVIETAIHKLSYALWKSKYAVFNAISVAFQTAAAIAEPIVVNGVINGVAKADMEKIVAKVLKKMNDQSPGLFPSGLNFDQLAKKVIDESLPEDAGKNDKNKGKKNNNAQQKPKTSLDDFSPELQAMVGFSPEDEAAAREMLTKAVLGEAEKSAEGAFQQTYFNPTADDSQPPPPPPAEVNTYAPPSSAPPPQSTYAPPSSSYAPPSQSSYAPSSSTYAPPQPAYNSLPALPPPYAIVRESSTNESQPQVKQASNVTEPARVGNTTVKASENATVHLDGARDHVANHTAVQERQLSTPIVDACRNRRRDMTFGNHGYQFSWLAGSPPLDWLSARNACRRQCMDLVSLETSAETEAIKNIVNDAWRQGRIQYSWTSGRLCDFGGCSRPDLQPILTNGWFWSGSGAKLNAPGYPWGTGQPNQAQGAESCVALLNPSVYNDPSGQFTLHDVGCHFQKPYICEDSDQLLGFIG